MEKLAAYFSLWTDSPAYGSSTGVVKIRQPFFFLGVLIGAMAHPVFDYYRDGSGMEAGQLIVAVIASLVTFPWVYYQAGLDRATMSFAKWCVAFQYGFFWPVIFKVIEKALSH
jgi:hypothetical protein